jgi:hypothetical protein
VGFGWAGRERDRRGLKGQFGDLLRQRRGLPLFSFGRKRAVGRSWRGW